MIGPLGRLRLFGLLCPCCPLRGGDSGTERDALEALSNPLARPDGDGVPIWWYRRVAVFAEAAVSSAPAAAASAPSSDDSDESSVYSSAPPPPPGSAAPAPRPRPPDGGPGRDADAANPVAARAAGTEERRSSYVPFAASVKVADVPSVGAAIVIASDPVHADQYDFVDEEGLGPRGVVDATSSSSSMMRSSSSAAEVTTRTIPLGAVDGVGSGGDAWDVLTGGGPKGDGVLDERRGDACECDVKVYGADWKRLVMFDVVVPPPSPPRSARSAAADDADLGASADADDRARVRDDVVARLNALVSWEKSRRSRRWGRWWAASRFFEDRGGPSMPPPGRAEDVESGGNFVLM